MLKISSILIGVRSLAVAKPFYENVFGVTFEEFRPPFASFVFDGVEFNIEEDAPTRAPDWARNYIGGRKHIALKTDDLDQFLSQAQIHGATLIKEPHTHPWGWREAIIADLDDNQFIVEQEIIS
ncbi:VOC family protein [Candidatus Gracilibacteria bacterium]|nr:VOC family protein [Candidatus Gracilibacteria bacterium]